MFALLATANGDGSGHRSKGLLLKQIFFVNNTKFIITMP